MSEATIPLKLYFSAPFDALHEEVAALLLLKQHNLAGLNSRIDDQIESTAATLTAIAGMAAGQDGAVVGLEARISSSFCWWCWWSACSAVVADVM